MIRCWAPKFRHLKHVRYCHKGLTILALTWEYKWVHEELLKWYLLISKNTHSYFFLNIFFLKILFIYSWEIERQRHRQREKQASCREPDVGLDPGTPGSWPEPKADTQPLSHPGVPNLVLWLNKADMERRHNSCVHLHSGLATHEYCKGAQK